MSPTASTDTVSVIDTATNTVTTAVSVGYDPVFVAVSPDGATAYVTNSDDGTVSVIDTATNTVVATVTGVGVGAARGGFQSRRRHRLCRQPGSDTMSVIDTATNTVIATVTALGDRPGRCSAQPRRHPRVCHQH